ncbi:MAG: TetR/AcrR family transcriptional regulator [bacterium]|nr:TetR/AcrR family transcriptional regulator [bacterium]
MSMKNTTNAVPRSREEAKQETREALMRAAALLFKSGGLDVSLDAVCAEAGYTRGAFYVHFRNRDELISAVMGRIGDQVLDALLGTGNEGAEENNDLLSLVQRFLQALVSGDYPLTRKGGLPPHQLLDACARSEVIRRQYVRLTRSGIDRLAAALRAGQQKGQIRQDLATEPVAAMLVSIVIGLHTMHDLDMKIDMAAGAQVVMQMLMPVAAG